MHISINNEVMSYLSLQLYDSIPMIRNLPLPFRKAFKNAEVI